MGWDGRHGMNAFSLGVERKDGMECTTILFNKEMMGCTIILSNNIMMRKLYLMQNNFE